MQTASVMQIYQLLLSYYGKQHWWPAESAFEMMVGAILTQNTNWGNVEKALTNLRNAQILDAHRLNLCSHKDLETLIRPAVFFRQKSKCLLRISQFYLQHGQLEGMKLESLSELRKTLLQVNGIGPETADSILLYATGKTIFVVDNYTKRIFHRVGLLPEKVAKYHDVQHFCHQYLTPSLTLYQQYHALIVIHAKKHCRKQAQCDDCPLLHSCQYGHTHNNDAKTSP